MISLSCSKALHVSANVPWQKKDMITCVWVHVFGLGWWVA